MLNYYFRTKHPYFTHTGRICPKLQIMHNVYFTNVRKPNVCSLIFSDARKRKGYGCLQEDLLTMLTAFPDEVSSNLIAHINICNKWVH